MLIRKYCRKETVVSLTLAVGVMFFMSACLGIILFEFIYMKYIVNGYWYIHVGDILIQVINSLKN